LFKNHEALYGGDLDWGVLTESQRDVWRDHVDAVLAVVRPEIEREAAARVEALEAEPLRVGDPVPSATFEQVLSDSERIRRERNDWMNEAEQLKARVAELEERGRLKLRQWQVAGKHVEQMTALKARVDLLTTALTEIVAANDASTDQLPRSMWSAITRARAVLAATPESEA
jgi:hypothetical protein